MSVDMKTVQFSKVPGPAILHNAAKEVKIAYDSFIENREVLSWNIVISSADSLISNDKLTLSHAALTNLNSLETVPPSQLHNKPSQQCFRSRNHLRTQFIPHITWLIFRPVTIWSQLLLSLPISSLLLQSETCNKRQI